MPELFTSRIKRAFANANVDAEKATGKKTDGEAIWSTNPTRLTMFGPVQELVFFRDDLSGRLRRNAVKFRNLEEENALSADDNEPNGAPHRDSPAADGEPGQDGSMEIDSVVERAESHIPAPKAKEAANATISADLKIARKLVKTILDQGYLSPFPLSNRTVLWDYAGSLQLYPLPTSLVIMDPEAPPFAVTYEGCHVMNPGPLTPEGRRGVAQWMEYDARTRKGTTREARY